MPDNLLLFHGGGPTAVLNSSLYGAVTEALKSDRFGAVYGAIGGAGGIIRGDFIDFRKAPENQLERLLSSPGSAIGTSRDSLRETEYEQIADSLDRHQISFVFGGGGNGTMDTLGKIYSHCRNTEIQVMGIPKTVDNDIAVTDHTPGYGSAARFIATAAADIACDVKSMPIHVVILEAMGRNVGWLAASAALAEEGLAGPDFIYFPECPFIEQQFLEDVQRKIDEKRGVLVVASEMLHDKDGAPIVKPIYTAGRSTYYDNVGTHLSRLIIQKLGYKARSEKPGITGRASILCQSSTDREEAVLVGREAVRAALRGETGKMVGFRRIDSNPYSVETFLIPIEEVMLHERKLPDEFINERGNGVTKAFRDWCRPLLGGPLPDFVSYRRGDKNE